MGYRFITAFFSLFLFAQVNAYVNPTADIELDMQGYDPTIQTEIVIHEFTGHDVAYCIFDLESKLKGNNGDLECSYNQDSPYSKRPGFMEISGESFFADVLLDPFTVKPELADSSFLDGATYSDVTDIVGTREQIDLNTVHPVILAGVEVTESKVYFVVRKIQNNEFVPLQARDLEIARLMYENSLQEIGYKLPIWVTYRR